MTQSDTLDDTILEKTDDFCTIDFQPIGKRSEIKKGTSLLESARTSGIALASTCGGMGKCGRCRVAITGGVIPVATQKELALFSPDGVARGERLACQTAVVSDMDVYVPPDSLITAQRLQLSGATLGQPGGHDPIISAHTVDVDRPSRQDRRGEFSRLVAALEQAGAGGRLSCELEVLASIPEQLRANNWRVNVFLAGERIVGLAPAGSFPVGIAIDLGTTKIAVAMLDLRDGRQLGVAGVMNPQIGYGEDLIARLTCAQEGPDRAHLLAAKAWDAINTLVASLLAKTGIDASSVCDICLVGNTAMSHLILKLPVAQLARSPYIAATDRPVDIPAENWGLKTAFGARVHVFGSVGGFVGGDHVAMILASNIYQRREVVLGIDIGTNSEIVLHNPKNHTLTSISCASGPAFEGGHIGHGMRAVSGAVENVRISEGRITLKTIDDGLPTGICGSGIIDAVAGLVRAGAVSVSGSLQRQHPLVQMRGDGAVVVLADASQSATGREITVSQRDISQIQLAKGAIRAGIDTLLAHTGTELEEIREVVVAGAFGSCLDLENVLYIGMLPRFPEARIVQVGNAALEGCKLALVSKEQRQQAEFIARSCIHLEATMFPGYSRFFAKGIQFTV